MNEPRITLKSCPKTYSRDLDKALSPDETINKALERIKRSGLDIYAGCRRVDRGRLGIPVFMGMAGSEARSIMPVRKQMGKGSSPSQAKASAIMELMERFAFFSFWDDASKMTRATWSKARALFGSDLIPVAEMLNSVNDTLEEDAAYDLLDLAEWHFYPATDLGNGRIVWLPLDWFRTLGEFNGSSAGNTNEESLLQGICELIERHTSCRLDREKPLLPTIDQYSSSDPVLRDMISAFRKNGVQLILKDLTLGMPLPTVAALAWDPATFPVSSEIVFTAGTSSSPEKAAIRAVTEVAQLAGDFCTNSCYEASGLPKFTSLDQFAWLLNGTIVPFSSLPDISRDDIRDELEIAVAGVAPIRIYAVETTNPRLGIPAHYCVAPGLQFRERDRNQSLGMFIGRKLAEDADIEHAEKGLAAIGRSYPDAHFLPFFAGLLTLRKGNARQAAEIFEVAVHSQPDPETAALVSFYAGHAWSQLGEWRKAATNLETALQQSPSLKEAANLLGVAMFRLGDYAKAEEQFDIALKLDKGSAFDLANRGIARKFQGKTSEAIEDLQAALELEPDLDFARKHLAELS